MSGTSNKKRTKKLAEKDTSLWGFLFSKEAEGEDITKRAFFANPSGEEEEEEEQEAPSIFREIWRRFNLWGALAIIIFLVFTIVLTRTIHSMWTPQDMKDIAGYADNGSARDLTALLRNANGQEISFTEAEINRFLRETCRMRQTGVFSIITHGNGLAVRIHDGYAELIIDRLIGSNIHQTTAVHLSFRQIVENGVPSLKVDFHGGEPLPGNLPRGGSIGLVGIPERHISVLTPALGTLLNCYPEINAIIEEHGYCPHFTQGKNGQDSRVSLVPYRPS
ncbi:MAG: hypothetical protein IKA23_05890 [Akkermansia sp.]|nr:hypothetical protein [Akkermansia sp.]MBR2314730.1 hypothetical protein [Akkermansia sp.]